MTLFILEHAFNCNDPAYVFHCQGLRGSPKRRPKFRTRIRVSDAICCCFLSGVISYIVTDMSFLGTRSEKENKHRILCCGSGVVL